MALLQRLKAKARLVWTQWTTSDLFWFHFVYFGGGLIGFVIASLLVGVTRIAPYTIFMPLLPAVILVVALIVAYHHWSWKRNR
jgi:hypothetical protein